MYMFLTRQAIRKIRIMTGLYYFLGVIFCSVGIICLYFSRIFSISLLDNIILALSLGILCFVIGAVNIKINKYSEGKGKLINLGNKLVLKELRPAEFIRLYEEKRDCPDNVVSKPDFEVLQLLLVAYEALGDKQHETETLEQMLLIAPKKKKSVSKLLKAIVFYNTGRVEEADRIYSEVLSEKVDLMTKYLFDNIIKSDRAMAVGDYAVAEVYYEQLLAKTSPKNSPLTILYAHYNLAKIYIATERSEEAKTHLNYCIENGGDTFMKSKATDILNAL